MKKKTINKFKKDSLFLSQSVLIPKVSIGYNNWACAITEYQYRVAALTINRNSFLQTTDIDCRQISGNCK